MSDGCTLWFDRLGDLDWRQCCDAHDLAYYQQTDKWEADVQLALCVADAGAPIIGIIMFVGVSLFGQERAEELVLGISTTDPNEPQWPEEPQNG